MDRRTLLAVIIMVAIYFVSTQFIWKNKTEQPKAVDTQTVAAEVEAAPKATEKPVVVNTENLTLDVNNDIAVTSDIYIANDKMKIYFSNKGATVHKVYLTDFHMSDDSPVQLIPENSELGGLTLIDEKDVTPLSEMVFKHSVAERGNSVTFYLESENTRVFEKTFTIMDNYALGMTVDMNGMAAVQGYDIDFGCGINDTENYVKNKRMDYKFIAQINNAVESLTLSKIKAIKEFSGKTDWAVTRSKYFLLGIIPDKAIQSNQITAFRENESPAFVLKVRNVDYSRSLADNYRLYFGPSDVDELKKFNVGIDSVVERGYKWLKPLAGVFAAFLKWLHKYIPNYGIVLIILAILLKAVLYPLTHKSFESGQKMQKVQPLIKDVQARYKSDPKRMQEELQKVYKEHGVSPFGGCLPLLLQMPIFIALYNVLRYSLDMRQAGFVGYITDLSEPDKLFILPIIMAVMMFLQQKMMTPKPMTNEKGEVDEKQAAMMQSQKMMLYVMPVMMFFIFRNMPAGLVLYWTTMNILSIVQQFYIKKRLQG